MAKNKDNKFGGREQKPPKGDREGRRNDGSRSPGMESQSGEKPRGARS